MNIADLAHSLITGRWKIDRAYTQEALGLVRGQVAGRMPLYAGAEPTRNRPMPAQLSTPEDYKQAWERIVLIRGARQMEEDLPFFDGILGDYETYTVGNLRYRADTGVPEADKVINDYLDWQFDQCDLSERQDLTKMARLAVRSYKRDGECGMMVFDTGDAVKLSAISGDRIGNPTLSTGVTPNDFNGIIVDLATGRPVLINIFRRLPKLNAYVYQQSVDPSDFLHYYELFRFEQYHGVTAFKNSIELGFDGKQINDFTRLNIKYRSSQLPFVTNEQGKPRGNGYSVQTPGPDGKPLPVSVDVDGVTQSFMKIGEGVVEYPNDFPNGQYGSIMEELKRECATGAKLPLEFCYRSEAGGVVQRFYVDKAMAQFSEEQRWLKRVILNPYKNRSIQKGIKTGLLNLAKFGLADKFERFKGSWQMGRAISVDYGREVDADIKQIEAGIMSPQDYVLETQGRTLEEVRGHIEQNAAQVMAAAKRVAESTGIPVELVLPYIAKRFPNPTTIQASADGAEREIEGERKAKSDLVKV